MIFRKAGREERELLERFLKENFEDVKIEGEIYALEGERIELFAVSEGVLKILERMPKHPFCVGFYLGEVKRGRFFPSLQLIVNYGKFGKRKVFVREKGEILFTMGRDVLEESVLREEGDIREGDVVFILNEKRECLGMGRREGNIYKNILDVGWYIRHGE